MHSQTGACIFRQAGVYSDRRVQEDKQTAYSEADGVQRGRQVYSQTGKCKAKQAGEQIGRQIDD